MKIDVVAFAPHPDDAELYCSGTLLALKEAGYTTGIVDITGGELSTRGTPEQRDRETRTASAILKLDLRTNLGIPDGNIALTEENRRKVIRVLREHTPAMVLLPYFKDRHPDHEHASRLVQEALFYSGVGKLQKEAEHAAPHRPAKAFYYQMSYDFEPDLIIDISSFFETKMAAIGAYVSQFHSKDYNGDEPETFISSQGFMESLTARSRRLGFLSGFTHGEAFIPLGPLPLQAQDLMRI